MGAAGGRAVAPDVTALRQSVVDGDVALARELARRALASGADLLATIEQGFAAGIRRVGELWEEGEYFLPELVQGAEAMRAAMAVLEPELAARHLGGGGRGIVVLGTVRGDLHDIGKSLVGTLLAAHGFAVHDLGTDVTTERFVEAARATGARVVGASALLTTTMGGQRELVAALAGAGLAARVMVGGAPTSAAWARQIGAAWAENALAAVALAAELVGGVAGGAVAGSSAGATATAAANERP